jgi:hypothetical protein
VDTILLDKIKKKQHDNKYLNLVGACTATESAISGIGTEAGTFDKSASGFTAAVRASVESQVYK